MIIELDASQLAFMFPRAPLICSLTASTLLYELFLKIICVCPEWPLVRGAPPADVTQAISFLTDAAGLLEEPLADWKQGWSSRTCQSTCFRPFSHPKVLRDQAYLPPCLQF